MQELTRAQEEYFKGSAIRGRDGQLMVCYHLTNAEFDAFDKDKIGGHNAFYGKGFYFSTSDKYDESFGEQFKGCFGQNQLECYIDMKNPLVIGDIDIFEIEEIMEYMRDNHPKYGQPDGPFEIAISPREINEDSEELQLTPLHWNQEIFKLGAWADYKEQLTNYAKENGYDGIIQAPLGSGSVEIVVFEPNQIKSINNLYPTKSNNFKDNSKEYLQEHLKDMSFDECMKITKHIKEQNKGKNVPDKQKDNSKKKDER